MIRKLRAVIPSRIVITLAVIYCLVLSTAAFGPLSCDKSKKDQYIAYARDVADSLEAAAPLINQLLPAKVAIWATIIPKGRRLIEAVAASDKTEAAQLIADIFPVVEEVVNSLSGNVGIRTALALANIGLHFLLNHLPSAASPGASRSAGMTKLQRYKSQPVWGCEYRPEKCKGL